MDLLPIWVPYWNERDFFLFREPLYLLNFYKLSPRAQLLALTRA